MSIVKVSPKFQIVIPKAIRVALGIQAGQRVQVIQYENRIEVIPVIDPAEARGFLSGIETDVPREPDRV